MGEVTVQGLVTEFVNVMQRLGNMDEDDQLAFLNGIHAHDEEAYMHGMDTLDNYFNGDE